MQRDRLIRLLDRCVDPAFALTRRGEIWVWNHAAEELFGYASSEALHQKFEDLLDPRGSLGRVVDEEYCERAVRDGHVASFDMRVKTRSGRRVWINVSVLVFEALRTTQPLIVHLAHDITAIKRREALIQRFAEAARHIVTIPDDGGRLVPVTPLSEQEQRLLRAFAEGKAPSEIARDLGIAAQTLRNHLHHINEKLGTHNRLEAVIHAIRRKLI
ncbi:MAG TPA: PAS domain S-box protein [Gemmatimonadales bacterium]|nr:PAS domain S-box protein [Gemmatimonadales bacterium]